MSNFIKKNKKTITFVIIVLLALGGIFAYRQFKLNQGEYKPSEGPSKKEIIKYDVNEYEVYNIKPEDVYRLYYKDYLQLLMNNPEKAYAMLTEENKKDRFNNDYDKFLTYTKKLDKSKLLSSDVVKYSVNKDKIIVVDSTNSSYTFYENGVWNYKVYIGLKY